MTSDAPVRTNGLDWTALFQRAPVGLAIVQAQGYFVGRPMPLAQLGEWLATSPWSVARS